MDDGGLNVDNDGGIVKQSRWAKESSNVGLQPLNRPTGESTLKEAPHLEIGDVLLGEFADLMASATPVSGIRRKMLTNLFFFAESTVNRLEATVNIIPRWIRKDV